MTSMFGTDSENGENHGRITGAVLDPDRHPFEVWAPVLDELGRATGTLQFDSRWSNRTCADERANAIGGIVR